MVKDFPTSTLNAGVSELAETERLFDWIRLLSGHLSGCRPCTECYARKLLDRGEPERLLGDLQHWELSDMFSATEKSAFALCEAVWLEPDAHILAAVLHRARQHFSEEALVKMALCILAVDDLNHDCTHDS